jgi:hypothetical protein
MAALTTIAPELAALEAALNDAVAPLGGAVGAA